MTDITKTIDVLNGFLDMLDFSGALIDNEEDEISTLLQQIRDYVENTDNYYAKLSKQIAKGLHLMSSFKNYIIDGDENEWMPDILTFERIEEHLVDAILMCDIHNRNDIIFPDTYELKPVEDDKL